MSGEKFKMLSKKFDTRGHFTMKCPARSQNVWQRAGNSPEKMSGEAQMNFAYSGVGCIYPNSTLKPEHIQVGGSGNCDGPCSGDRMILARQTINSQTQVSLSLVTVSLKFRPPPNINNEYYSFSGPDGIEQVFTICLMFLELGCKCFHIQKVKSSYLACSLSHSLIMAPNGRSDLRGNIR